MGFVLFYLRKHVLFLSHREVGIKMGNLAHTTIGNYELGKTKAEIYEDLDAACALVPNAVASNNYIVLIQVMDDTNNPVVNQSLVL